MFVAYLDESGHSSNTDFFSLATCVAEWSDWRIFNQRWRTALDGQGAPYLHMREFAHSTGVFKDWTNSRRIALMSACLACLDGLDIVTIAAALRVSDFRRLSPEDQGEFVDPTFCCFQECLGGLGLHGYLGSQLTKTDVIYSRQDEFSGMLRKLYAYAQKHWQDGALLGVLNFQDMRDVPGLQLADLVAYELRHFYHLKVTRPELPVRVPFQRIIDHQLAQNAGLLKYLPGWYLSFQAKGISTPAQAILWSDIDLWKPLLMQLAPEPLKLAQRLSRIAEGRDIEVVNELRRRRLRDTRQD